MSERPVFQMRIDPTLKAKMKALADKEQPPQKLSDYVRRLFVKETAGMATPRKKDSRRA